VSTLPDLQSAIDRLLALPATGQLLQLNSATCERAYEAYVFSLCLQAVKDAGGSATMRGINSGANPVTVVFRGSPGRLSSTDQDYCYADCRMGGKTFEVHVDVTFEGQSGATHEIDVSIINARHAQDARSTGRLPRTNKHLICAFECKFYSSQPPGVALARTFVGLTRDCSANRLNGFVANRATASLNQYLSTSWAPKPFTDLSPLSPNSERRFIANIEQILRQWSSSR
jgi:hypothetical protein